MYISRKKKQLNIQNTKLMAPGPITLWRIGGEAMETVADSIFLGC